MLLHLPASLDELLVLLSGPFSQPSYQTFRAMVVGQISQTGLRTVTGMLVGSRLSGAWHHARAHRFFSNAVWPVDELGLRLAVMIAERFCEPDAAVLVAVDDTLLHRLGRKIHATYWHHDATANAAQKAVAWGNNWVVVGIVVQLPFMERAVCLSAGPVQALAAQTQGHPERQRRSAAAGKATAGKGNDRSARRSSRGSTDRSGWRRGVRLAGVAGPPTPRHDDVAAALQRRDLQACAGTDRQAGPAPQMGLKAAQPRKDGAGSNDQVDRAHRRALRQNRDPQAPHDRLPRLSGSS
jgi:hypothetical protein